MFFFLFYFSTWSLTEDSSKLNTVVFLHLFFVGVLFNNAMSERVSFNDPHGLLSSCSRVTEKNGILLPKVFWPTVRKKCSSDREKLLKFETEGREFAKFWKFKQIFTYICTFGFGFGIRPKARCFSGQIFGFGLKWKPYFRSFTVDSS